MGRKGVRATAARSKNVASNSKSTDSKHESCALCCERIVENEDEALFCEGNCQQWVHRYCAGISEKHYKSLDSSSPPFLCYACYVEAQRKLVANFESVVATLTAEIAELRKVVSEKVTVSSNAASDSWSTVVKRGRKRNVANGNDHRGTNSGAGNSRLTRTQAAAGTPSGSGPRSNVSESTQSQNRSTRPKIRVEGKRKVWGTLKVTTANAISSTIKLVTKIEGLSVKRKFSRRGSSSPQASGPNEVSKWWFIISGDESLLDRLSKEWAAVQLQTNWSIEPVFTYDSNSLPVSSSHHHASPLMQPEPTEEMPGSKPSISPILTSPSTHSPHTDNANQSLLHTIPSPRRGNHLPLESVAAVTADQQSDSVSSISPSSADPQSS